MPSAAHVKVSSAVRNRRRVVEIPAALAKFIEFPLHHDDRLANNRHTPDRVGSAALVVAARLTQQEQPDFPGMGQ